VIYVQHVFIGFPVGVNNDMSRKTRVYFIILIRYFREQRLGK